MSAPLVVNTADGEVWTRREGSRDGEALYAPEKCGVCPQFVMVTLTELAELGISGSADVLPMPVAPEPQALSVGRLAEIEARAAAATAGPWCTDSWEIYQGTEYVPGISFWIGETCRGTSELGQDRADAAFVAAARSDVPVLVAEVRRQAAQIAELGFTVQKMCDALTGHDCPPPDETPMQTVTRVTVRLMEAERLLAELEAERARYVGVEPTIAEEMAYLSRCIDSVLAFCDEQDKAARLFELPQPEWIAKVREAADGLVERASYPPALPWAALMDDEDLLDFLDELTDAATRNVSCVERLAAVEEACGAWRLIAEAQHGHNTAPGPDALTVTFAPTQALRDEPPLTGCTRLDASAAAAAEATHWKRLGIAEPAGEFDAFLHHENRLGHDLPETGGV